MDRDVASTHPRFPPFQFDVPETPDAVQEDAAVQLGLSTAPRVSLRERLETRLGLSLTTIVAVLTALTLATSLLIGAIKIVAGATRSYDQMERGYRQMGKVLTAVAHLDSSVAHLESTVTVYVARVEVLEGQRSHRRPPRIGAHTP